MTSTIFGDTNATYAQVIADSTCMGRRLTTMEIQVQRFMLPEFNTHRAFSRNSASSRAIPFKKQIKRMEDMGIAFPVSWPAEQSGMQGGEEVSEKLIHDAKGAWTALARASVQTAQVLNEAGIHKSVVNRLLEPFMWHKIIVSATEWENFFTQRCSPLAQPEIRLLAENMAAALAESTPEDLAIGDFHTPYITADDAEFANSAFSEFGERMLVMCEISAARCARVSYLTHDGKRSIDADLELFEKLVSASPAHWSPLEHVATPLAGFDAATGNFTGWKQLRHIFEVEGGWNG